MLLRAQYGGMACDVNMLQSYSSLWLRRFQTTDFVPQHIVSSLPKSKQENAIHVQDIPHILHEPSREKSRQLITLDMVSPGGLIKLNEGDICCAGIDFHCSPVVDTLLSLKHVHSSLRQKLSSDDRDWIASQVKACIWNNSSGVNRRSPLDGRPVERKQDALLKAVWNDILRVPYNDFTKTFVRQRLV